MQEQSKILVVDDDKEIVRAICTLLEKEGYLTYKSHNGFEALDLLASYDVDLIILDIMMPSLDGLSATMKIREEKNIPIILLSAKSEDSDKILGLSMGADDYVTKPYNPMELLARVRSQLRRYLYLGNHEQTQKQNKIAIGGLELDLDSKQILLDGEYVNLTATEFKILELLMNSPGRVFSAEQIYEKVWQEDAYSVENTVMVHIRRIREKIEVNLKEPKYLKVVWGIGYKMEKI